MFTRARLRLTLWYLLIITLISVMFSISIYRILTGELEREANKITIRYEQEYGIVPQRGGTLIEPEIIQSTENRILFSLIYVNLVIVVVAGLGGFVLAGITLRPIQEMVDEQNRFIADASHELRTPLTALKSEIEVYMRSKIKSQKDADTLLKSNLEEVNKLQYLSDNLIQLTKPKQKAESTTTLLSSLQMAIDKVAKTAAHKKITISNTARDYSIKCNKDQLMQLFGILLDNSIKYSPSKSTIVISTRQIDHMIYISIQDKGIGISEKDIPHIFDRFYRADISRSKQQIPGYGLGLSIAKNIVESYHGTITVKSTEGKGSTFTITLPTE